MPSLLRVREYVKAAKLARHCAESERHPQARQILREIERSYHRLVEIEKWMADQQQHSHPFAHFGMFNGRDAATVFRQREETPLLYYLMLRRFFRVVTVMAPARSERTGTEARSGGALGAKSTPQLFDAVLHEKPS